jgi:fatty-acyl-CoA synthase
MTMTMMNTPLTMSVLMDRGPLLAPNVEIVSKMRDRTHRCTYAELGKRARQLANALAKLGVKQGDRVATLAWNSYRHLEVYYAVPCMGAVLHTLNLRLSSVDLEYIINHAEDSVVCVDEDLLRFWKSSRVKSRRLNTCSSSATRANSRPRSSTRTITTR